MAKKFELWWTIYLRPCLFVGLAWSWVPLRPGASSAPSLYATTWKLFASHWKEETMSIIDHLHHLSFLCYMYATMYSIIRQPNTLTSSSSSSLWNVCACKRQVAARYGRTIIIEELLSAGVPVDVKDLWGHTPLHYAGLCGHKNAIVSLIQNGAEVSAQNDMGHTPLDYAASEESAVKHPSCQANTMFIFNCRVRAAI